MSRPAPITVRETIHHGDYFNVREQTIEQTYDPTRTDHLVHLNDADWKDNVHQAVLENGE